jgi:hypothetical protein
VCHQLGARLLHDLLLMTLFSFNLHTQSAQTLSRRLAQRFLKKLTSLSTN